MEFNIKKMFHQHQFLIKQNPVQQQILSKTISINRKLMIRVYLNWITL